MQRYSLVSVLLLAACPSPDEDSCNTSAECLNGHVCQGGTCIRNDSLGSSGGISSSGVATSSSTGHSGGTSSSSADLCAGASCPLGCNPATGQCRTPSDIAQQAYLKASNNRREGRFGYSVALSADGNTLAAGALSESSGATGVNGNQADISAPWSGAVYVFTRTGVTWTQQAYLKASNAESNESFGSSVALSADGNTLAVGATGEDSGATGVGGSQADNSAESSGAVYVFTRSGGTWTQQAYVKASNTDALDYFGSPLVLSADGSTLAAGALGEASHATGINGDQGDNSFGFAGAVYVFTRSEGTWAQQAYIKASNTLANASFGGAISLSSDGNTLAAGSQGERSSATGVNGNQADTSAVNAGAAYVFTRSNGTWTQQAYLKASNADVGDYFGAPLSLSADGTLLAVGAHGEGSRATGVNGDQDDDSTVEAGAVYVFTRSNGTWMQQAYVKASNTEAEDNFGGRVALSADGTLLAVQAWGEDGAATGINGNQADNSTDFGGAVYLFARTDGAWTQQAYVKASNTGAGDQFGSALALSADGSTLAAATYVEDSSGTGVNGNQPNDDAMESGAVYVFTL